MLQVWHPYCLSPIFPKTMNSVISKRLDGKVAIITGGASGFGESTVRLFAKHGANVVIADVQDDRGNSICADFVSAPSEVIYVRCDVTKEADVKNALDTAVSKFGKVDIVFSNAGIPGNPDFSILEFDSENVKRILDVNVLGSFLVAKHAARAMIPAKTGSIIFTSSMASVISGEAPYSYSVSKHAVVGLMKNLCVELGQHGIRVNCISPRTIATPMLTNATGLDKAVIDEIICSSSILKGVVPSVEDVAEAALYLGSGESKFVSGINLVVDGGYSTTNQDYLKLFGQKLEALRS